MRFDPTKQTAAEQAAPTAYVDPSAAITTWRSHCERLIYAAACSARAYVAEEERSGKLSPEQRTQALINGQLLHDYLRATFPGRTMLGVAAQACGMADLNARDWKRWRKTAADCQAWLPKRPDPTPKQPTKETA